MDPDYETKLSALLTAVEQHVESGRCKVVHTPAGIGALVPASTVRARYSKIYRTYNRIQSVLASDSNEYLPIYRLHDDLLVDIWDQLNVCDRNNVAAVSRRFRSLALNTARLWRFINLDGSLCVPRIETLLKRAGVAPLHIRATDHHLRDIRPTLPLSSYPWYIPPPPPLPPPPPHGFYPNLPSPPGFYPYVPPSPGLFYPQYPPLQPNPIPLKSLQLSAKILSRATVLDVISQKYQSTYNLEIEPLTVPMPILRSLRLRSLRVSVSPRFHYLQSAYSPTMKPFFGGHTPLLRHLSVIRFNLSWADPLFRNLTYLLVRRPDAPVSISVLVQVLRACPSLAYLGLEAAILSTDPNQTFSSVELPALQRLYITDMDTRRITTALNRINAPNVLECDFTSADWGWFDNAHLTINSSPFNNLQTAQHVTLRATEHYAYRWSIECRWSNQAVRFHFDPVAVTTYYSPGARNEDNDTMRFIDTLRRSPILFGHVRSLTLRGAFSGATLTRIFGLFPSIESLSTRSIYPPRGTIGIGENGNTIDILSVQYCPQLRAIDIGAWPTLAPSNLLMWLSARSAPGSKCSRMTRVVVTSPQPLPSTMRLKIASLLDKLLWRKAAYSGPSYDDETDYALLYPTTALYPFVTVSAPHRVGDGSWDTDDEEERTRVPPPNEYPSAAPLDDQDDPTLVYCGRALQGRWDYFTIPET